MGKPRKLTRDLIKEAATLKGQGLNNQDICHVLRVNESTWYGWLQTETSTGEPVEKNRLEMELIDALKNAEADYKAALLLNIARQGEERDWKAHAWLLERKYPSEFGRVDRLQAEVKQQATATVAITHYFDYGDEEGDGE